MERLLKFYQRINLWFLEMGNDTYNYIKQIETVCVANYLKRYDKLKASREYFYKLLEESKNNLITERYLTELYELITELTDHPLEIMEFFGCFLHFGHPSVDELAGIDSLRENSTMPITEDPAQLAKVSGAFNRMFTIQIIAKKKRWPKFFLRD